VEHVYAKPFILNLSKWIEYEGENWKPTEGISPPHQPLSSIKRSVSADNLSKDEISEDPRSFESNSQPKKQSAGSIVFLRKLFFGNDKSSTKDKCFIDNHSGKEQKK
jgi:hypothetical protein